MAPANKSSRIIVKNLPKQISDERVKEHFAQKGEITDVKLKFTRSVEACMVKLS
jgi:RNA recognition motif-containing protein